MFKQENLVVWKTLFLAEKRFFGKPEKEKVMEVEGILYYILYYLAVGATIRTKFLVFVMCGL